MQKIIFMRKSDAVATCGTLTQTSKMPCKSYSLPTEACKTGYKMSKIEGSICASCYADRGFYSMYAKTIKPAQFARLDDAHRALGQATAELAIFEGVQAEVDDLMDERDDALAALDPLGCKLHDTRAELELTRDKLKTYRSALMAIEAEVPAHIRQFIREVLA